MAEESKHYLVIFNSAERGPFSSGEIQEMLEQKILTYAHPCSLNTQPRHWKQVRDYISSSDAYLSLSEEEKASSLPIQNPLFSQLKILFILFVLMGGILFIAVPILSRSPHERPTGLQSDQGISFEAFVSSPQLFFLLLIGAVIFCSLLLGILIFAKIKPKS